MWFFGKKGYTGIKIACTNKLAAVSAVKVYDLGHGAFVYQYCGDDFRYLAEDGGFDGDMPITSVNGDYVSWRPHAGTVSGLVFLSKETDYAKR